MDNDILEKVLQAIELSNSSTSAYYNLDSGNVIWISDFMFRDEYEKLSEEIESGNYVEMPTSYGINDYKIMEDFIDTVENPVIKNELLNAIIGKGAFARFKSKINYYHMDNEWYLYRDNAYIKLAQKWIDEHIENACRIGD